MVEPTLTFVAIVKNESKIITRCLDSVKDIVDYIVISDTGSTDDTVSIIEKYISDHPNLKGKVYSDVWKNFGHNRTLSVKNAQAWLTEQGVDKSMNFLITIDADMCLLNENFKKRTLLSHTTWQIRQKNSSLTYYNTRIFRADMLTRCIGVTHEYWGCDSPNNTFGKLESLFCNDIGDGGAKGDKYTRDIAYLTQGLIDEPKNERYMFYLAQSYKDSGDFEKSIEWYLKRIEAGGWVEEIFISYKCIGDMYISLGNPVKAVNAWCEGYNACPARSETLWRAINYYRNISSKNRLAWMYLKTAINIDYPADYLLFIEHNVYNYMIMNEISIISYHVNKKTSGIMACQYLILENSIPRDVKDGAFSNNYFYLSKIDWDKHSVLNFPEINKDVWKSSSACLSQIGHKGYRGVVRAVNYSISDSFQYSIRDPNNTVRTKNFWIHMKDNNKDVKSCYEIICTAPTIRNSHIQGLEDLRITYLTKDKIVGLSIDWERGLSHTASVVINHFTLTKEGKYIIDKCVATSYKANECQKNWAPFSENGKLYAIYSHHPLTILELNVDTGKETVIIEKYSKYDLSKIRGSSIPVKYNDEWYIVVHEVVQKDTRKYYHRILKYSKDWGLLEISLPFFFQTLFVEFTLSAIIDAAAEEMIIPFSTRDNTTETVSIKLKNIAWVPKDIKQWFKNTQLLF